MEELPKSPKQNGLRTPGETPSPGMEEDCGKSECCREDRRTPSSGTASIDRGDSCTQSPASPLEPGSQYVLSPALTDTLSAGWAHSGSVRKSRTHDCVAGMGWQAEAGGATPDGGWTPTVRRRGRLVSSVSFSGFGVSSGGRARLLRENRGASGRSRDIIDYRNLTPQVPFVPSIAKSIPKKRISLRRPRKAIKDLFGTRRHKQDKATSPCTPTPRAGEQETAHRGTRKQARQREHHCARHLNVPEHNDLLSDSSADYCHNICEDVASLKSFGSQTGCGEIFADEEHRPSLEALRRQDLDKDACDPGKASPAAGSFQGGVEQMASPAHSEVLDLFGMWESLGSVGRAVLLRQSPVKEVSNPVPVVTTPADPDGKQPATSPSVAVQTPGHRTDTVTQKSDNQETVSTSDEGYYDYISPGLEDTSRDALTPCLSARFPRDSYSGDALYELFYDPNESGMTPIFDDEAGMSESLLGLSGDLPLSMYSFHVGAEENMAPPLALDFVSQELLQSSWRGKDCLMKLCDTEISLAMGIVNWLKQKAEKTGSSEALDSITDAEKGGAHLDGGRLAPEVQEAPKSQPLVDDCDAEKEGSKESMACRADVSPVSPNVPSKDCSEELVPASPESDGHTKSQVKTPTNGFCFRIFNKDSPLTPNKDLASPMLRSPGSGTSTVFLLAINKESLCETCRGSLKQGSRELYLCASCVSFIEHIKTSDLVNYTGCLRSSSAGTPRSLPRGFLDSPMSPCATGGDVDILRILEQCIGQVSSMKINGSQGSGDRERGPPLLQLGDGGEKEVRPKEGREQSHRYLKSEHKRKSGHKERNGLGMHSTGIDSSSLPQLGADSPHSPSVLEAGGLGLVTTDGSDKLVLEAYKSPRSDASGDQPPTQAPRPKSLPLSNSAFTEFASSQSHGAAPAGEGGAKGQPRERVRRNKKPGAHRGGACGYVMPEEKKVDRRRRMKK